MRWRSTGVCASRRDPRSRGSGREFRTEVSLNGSPQTGWRSDGLWTEAQRGSRACSTAVAGHGGLPGIAGRVCLRSTRQNSVEVMGLCSNPCWIGGAVEHHSFASDGSAQIWQHTLTGAIELTLLIWSGPLPAQDSVLDDRNPATSTCGWFDQMNSACESPGLSVPARNGSNGRYPATPLSQAIVCPVRERIQFASRT